MLFKEFFWLHIKKSAGITVRNLLQPYYTKVDKTSKPKNFIQSSRQEYNDILNNYRVVLGEYQFKRCLFAKTYLYPEEWDSMLSFAFSREPVDRCVSMFFYMFHRQHEGTQARFRQFLKHYLVTRKFVFRTSYSFDLFLDFIEQSRTSDSIFLPINNHFTTHTAPMSDDVTDSNGSILLTKIFRLENLVPGINYVFESCGLDKRITDSYEKLNANSSRGKFTPSKSQLNRILNLYENDFEIYENAE